MRLKFIVFGLMLLGVFSVGCSSPPSTLMKALEEARQRAGLRTVQEKWRIASFHRRSGEISWVYPSNMGGGEAKKVHFELGRPIWEEDYYHSGRRFPSPDGEGMAFELLTLHFDYSTNLCAVRLVSDKAELQTLVTDIASDIGVGTAEAFRLADLILSKWGMKR